VGGVGNGDDSRVSRRSKHRFNGVDRYAVAHHPVREHRIGHFLERRQPAREGCAKDHVAH
jgi:hypothetical protein